MALMRFNEQLGTSLSDSLNAMANTVNIGLQGDDTFKVSPSGAQDWIMLIGGQGNDTYIAKNNSVVTIMDNADSTGDKIIATGIGLRRLTTDVATIDHGRHLIFGDIASNQYVVILDWQQPENLIETIQLSDGTYSFSYISSLISNLDAQGYLEDFSWSWSGLLDGTPYSASDVNEAINYYKKRNQDLQKNLTGGAGNDTLTGDAADNVIFGYEGNDTLIGGAGDDTLTGGLGKDKYIFKTGSGHDVITADLSNTEDTIVLSDIKTLADFNALQNIQNGDDLTLVLNENDSITIKGWYKEGAIGSIQLGNGQVFGYRPGSDGDDTLIGTKGNDILMGGSGNDTIDGAAGKDAISAGDGDDTIIYDAADTMIDGGAGNDTLDASGSKGAVTLDMTSPKKKFSNIENLTGGSGNDVLVGDENANILIGGAGNDTLTGGAGDDTLTGGLGKDKYIIKTGSGHDVITADLSNTEDTLVLSDIKTLADFNALINTQVGDDLTLVLNANDSVTIKGWYKEGAIGSIQLGNGQVFGYRPGTDGNDKLIGTKGNDILMGGSGNDMIDGGAGKDAISAGDGDDTIIYDAADTMIDGGAGNDTLDASSSKGALTLDMTSPKKKFSNIENLSGGSGNDKLVGDENANILNGGAGNDILSGGAGNDILIGGAGADTYVFVEGTGSDTIAKDSYNKLDTIDISAFKEPELEFSAHGQNLEIRLSETDKITLEGYFEDADSKVGKIKAKIDGKVMTVGFQSGDNANNDLTGGAGSDLINGLAGNDTIHGWGGNDWLSGGEGDDTIYGDDGNDEIWDNTGINKMYGGKGNDIITADNGVADNELYGEDGNDTLEAWAIGNTILDGGVGNDTLFLSGNGTMIGGAGNDTYIIGGLWNGTEVGNIIIDNSVSKGSNGQDILKIFDDRSDNAWFKPKQEDFTYAMNGTDLLMTYQGDQGTITIKDWASNPIEKIMFADGSILKDFKL